MCVNCLNFNHVPYNLSMFHKIVRIYYWAKFLLNFNGIIFLQLPLIYLKFHSLKPYFLHKFVMASSLFSSFLYISKSPTGLSINSIIRFNSLVIFAIKSYSVWGYWSLIVVMFGKPHSLLLLFGTCTWIFPQVNFRTVFAEFKKQNNLSLILMGIATSLQNDWGRTPFLQYAIFIKISTYFPQCSSVFFYIDFN